MPPDRLRPVPSVLKLVSAVYFMKVSLYSLNKSEPCKAGTSSSIIEALKKTLFFFHVEQVFQVYIVASLSFSACSLFFALCGSISVVVLKA